MNRPRRGRGRLLFVLNDAGYFLSHRLPLARAAAAKGWEVAVATRPDARVPEIEAEGFTFLPVPIRRFRPTLWGEARLALALWRCYRHWRPGLIHVVTLRALPAASVAARLAGVPASIYAITGGGDTFARRGLRAGALKAGVRLLLRMVQTGRSRLIVQNPEDREALAPAGQLRARTVLIRGSGVDLTRYWPADEPAPPVAVLLAARLIRKKGVPEFVAAARLLRARGQTLRFLLAGVPDPGNPAAVTRAELEGWQAEGLVEWLGYRTDMEQVLADCHIACLPSSYGEGVPKSLIEAAAAGRPLVATDIPGCREIVRDGVNGLLVPPDDPAALAEALLRLAGDAELRRRFGAASRQLAEAGFGEAQVIAETLATYDAIA